MFGDIICNGMTWFRADFHLHTKSEKAFQNTEELAKCRKTIEFFILAMSMEKLNSTETMLTLSLED